jgi:hypothetical protein
MALSALPAVTAPDTILPAVLTRIAEVNPFEAIPATVRVPRRSSRWVPLALAASILLAVGAALHFSNRPRVTVVAVDHGALPRVEASRANAESAVATRGPVDIDEDPDPLPPASVAVLEAAPAPRRSVEPPLPPVYASPLVAPPKFAIRTASLPMLVPMTELAMANVQEKLQKHLAAAPLARIDLFANATDMHTAVESFLAVAKAHGLSVTLDAAAAERLRRKHPGAMAIYTDADTPAEVVKLLAAMLPNAQQSAAPVVHTLHAVAASTADRKDLKDLFAIDAIAANAMPHPAARSLTDDTMNHLSQSLAKFKPEKTAFATTYLPTSQRTPASLSRELKAWSEKRGTPKPGTVGLLLVIR